MKFIIDYSKWRCGLGSTYAVGKGDTKLLNRYGFMCCLGQCEAQLGRKEKDLLNKDAPFDLNFNLSDADIKKDIFIKTMDGELCSSELAEKAMEINDSSSINSITRIKRLSELFRKHGHELEFINVPN